MFPGKAAYPFVIDYLFLMLYAPFKCQPSKLCCLLQPFTDTPGQRPGLLIIGEQGSYYTAPFVTEVIKALEKIV